MEVLRLNGVMEECLVPVLNTIGFCLRVHSHTEVFAFLSFHKYLQKIHDFIVSIAESYFGKELIRPVFLEVMLF